VLHPRVRQTHRADTEAARHAMGETEGAMATVEDPIPLVDTPRPPPG